MEMFCNGKTVRDARRNKKRRRKKELRDRSSRRVMNHKENFDSPVDVRQASNDRERERERKPMEKSADGPAAIFFCFKRLIRLCRRSWQFLPEPRKPEPRFSPSSYLMQHASSKRISAPILRSTRLPAIFDGNVLPPR